MVDLSHHRQRQLVSSDATGIGDYLLVFPGVIAGLIRPYKTARFEFYFGPSAREPWGVLLP